MVKLSVKNCCNFLKYSRTEEQKHFVWVIVVVGWISLILLLKSAVYK